MNYYPLVYVLTLNWNGKDITAECIESILISDYPNFKVVVIDNGSSDGSVQSLRERFGSNITILENETNLGYGRGLNVGLEFGFEKNKADYCLIMNNDTILDSRALLELALMAETEKKIGFVTGKVYIFDTSNILQTVGKREDPVRWDGGHIGNKEEDNGQYDKVCERFWADDVFILVRKKLYEEIGGYNPLFFLQCEVIDWQARAKELGYKIMYTPHAKLWHRWSWTLGRRSAKKAFYNARNPMLVILLHKSPEFFKKYFWLHFRKDILKSSLSSMRQIKISVAAAKWCGFFSGIWWGIKNRKFSSQHFI